ncbi:hypothetical protein FKW77_000641 [Venturia effusa]|uniref:Uncharacterized protein n=1 Tax=Venturia effusa TaxID=50376 RepID=A0A517L0Q7_9PEZI|nr:hypothetical protein FKW77_000641 [Venturia effusa]
MPPKKRGRGRPPKTTAIEKSSQVEEERAQLEGVAEEAAQVRRVRGSLLEQKAVEEPSHVGEDSAFMNEVENLRRGRGRPPKKKVVEKPNHIDDDCGRIAEPQEGVAEPAPKAKARMRARPFVKKTVATTGQQSALEALKQRRDAAMRAKNAKETSSAERPGVTPASKPTALQRLLRASTTPGSSGERVAATATARSPPPARREKTPSTELDTEGDLYSLSPGGEASKLRLESRRQSVQYPRSALKAQGTPAVETSVLALTNFKRRPRQGSIIRMVQQTSELGDTEQHLDVDIENDPLLQGLENTTDDFEDFNPEHESTPLHQAQRKSDVREDETWTSSSRKRKHAAEDDEIQVLQSSPPIPSSPPARHQSPVRSFTSASLPEVIESTQEEIDMYSETMAPPKSSSEPVSPVRSPVRADKRRKLSGQHDQDNEDEGSPSPAQAKKQTSRKKASGMLTAALRSLLPKPRRKIRAAKRTADYDFPSTDDDNYETLVLQDSDDDELAHAKTRGRDTKTPMRKVSGNRKKGPKTVSPASTRTEMQSANVKGKKSEKSKVKKTYGRVAMEKENDPNIEIFSNHGNEDEGDETKTFGGRKKRAGSVAVSNISKVKELEDVKKKFAEVDDFEMEFESVDLGGGSSSPWR